MWILISVGILVLTAILFTAVLVLMDYQARRFLNDNHINAAQASANAQSPYGKCQTAVFREDRRIK